MADPNVFQTSQYLTFTLDGELFAFDISRGREVLEFSFARMVPQTPEYVRGVINLRGMVVPVVDLRLRFGMSKTEKELDTCVIITDVEVDGVGTVLGILADSVQEVLDLEPAQIDPPLGLARA